MRVRGKVVGGVMGGLVAVIGAVVLFLPAGVCACVTPDMEFAEVFDVTPSTAGTFAVRHAVLKRLPLGTPAAQVAAACEPLSAGYQRGKACALSADGSALVCQIPASESWVRKIGSRIDFELRDGRLAEVRVEHTDTLFGQSD